MADELYQPQVPSKVRDVAYWAGFIVAAVVLLVTGIAPIYATAIVATQITATAGVISAVFAFIAGGLGVAFRPGAQNR